MVESAGALWKFAVVFAVVGVQVVLLRWEGGCGASVVAGPSLFSSSELVGAGSVGVVDEILLLGLCVLLGSGEGRSFGCVGCLWCGGQRGGEVLMLVPVGSSC